MPDRYILLGDRTSNSPSPAMMNAAFRASKVDARYERSDVSASELARAFASLKTEPVRGLNITIPHKTKVLSFLDSLDPISSRVRAVNTVKRSENAYVGYNTDVEGILGALSSSGLPMPHRAVVLGTGGTARAFCAAMEKAGCEEVTAYSRSPENNTRFSAEMAESFPGLTLRISHFGSGQPAHPLDLLFNATPMGSRGIPLHPWVARLLGDKPAVFDAVYQSGDTELVGTAKGLGCPTIQGYEMLLHQALGSFRIWTGLPPPYAAMRNALLGSLEVPAN